MHPQRNKYRRILNAVFGSVWVIRESKLIEIVDFLQFAAAGGTYSAEEVAERIGPQAKHNDRVTTGKADSIAVIPIQGIISQKVDSLDDVSTPNSTSTERVSRNFRAALSDESVKSIVLDVDSPGGTVFGVQELATEIFQARGKKRIVAVVNSQMDSAAYWIGSAADEIAMMPGTDVGSIGAYMMHVDMSKAMEMEGFNITFIQSGKFKTEGNQFEPLTEEALEHFQSQADEVGTIFNKAVARNRGISTAKVRSDFGQGRTFGADEAMKIGMIDRIATFDQTLQRLAGRKGARAESEMPAVAAEASEPATDNTAVVISPQEPDAEERADALNDLGVSAAVDDTEKETTKSEEVLVAANRLAQATRRQRTFEAGLI